MQLGWIDFSKSERKRILDVLSLLEPKGTLDELGIAQIRDGFSDLFFPGSSTIQTRAKYFFLVPYAFKTIEASGETNPRLFLRKLNEIEKQCAIQLLTVNPKEDGIIGDLTLRSTNNKGWVKRSPSEIYWAGMRTYNIFCFKENISIKQYVHLVCKNIKDRQSYSNLGNSKDSEEEFSADDSFSGTRKTVFWNSAKQNTSNGSWIKRTNIQLTPEEAVFLKKQIIEQCPNSLYAIILEKYQKDFIQCESFEDLETIINRPDFPNKVIQKQYKLSLQFSEFNYLLRVVYNKIIFEDKYDFANEQYNACMEKIKDIASLNIEALQEIFPYLNNELVIFLNNAKSAMLIQDSEKRESQLKKLIIDREKALKGETRAKTCNPGKYAIPGTGLIGGEYLDYRFRSTVRTIINDITKGEKNA